MAKFLDYFKDLKYARPGIAGNPAAVAREELPEEQRKEYDKIIAGTNLVSTLPIPGFLTSTIPFTLGAMFPFVASAVSKAKKEREKERAPILVEEINGDTSIRYDLIYNPKTHGRDTANVVVSSPRGETHIDNLSTPTTKGSYYFIPVNDSEGNPWGLSAPKDFSQEGLLKTRNKVRTLLKRVGGKLINVSK